MTKHIDRHTIVAQSSYMQLITRTFQILPSLMGIADKPVGDLPVVFADKEISRTEIGSFGMCRFSVSNSLNARLDSGELTTRARYVELEFYAGSTKPKRIRLMGIDILDREYFLEKAISCSAASLLLLGMTLADSVVSTF